MTEEQTWVNGTARHGTARHGTTVCTQVGPRLWLTDGLVGAVRNRWCSLSDGANRPLARVLATQGMSAPSLQCAHTHTHTHTHTLVTVIYTAIKESPVICVRMCCSTARRVITKWHFKCVQDEEYEKHFRWSHVFKWTFRSSTLLLGRWFSTFRRNACLWNVWNRPPRNQTAFCTFGSPTADPTLCMCRHTLCSAFLSSDSSSRVLFFVIKQLKAQNLVL